MPIDTLSVATQGYLENPVAPAALVSQPRNELRYATLGWIVMELPGPGTVWCVRVDNAGFTDFDAEPDFTDAAITPVLYDMEVVPFTDADIEDGGTIAELAPEFTDVRLKLADTKVDVEDSTGVQLPMTGTKADSEGSPLDADVEPDDTDYDPQDRCR